MIQYFNPLSWMRWSRQFVAGWFLSFPVRDVPKSMIAILVIGTLVVSSIAAWSEKSGWRERLLDRQLQTAIERDDYGTAELVLDRKIRLTPDDTQLLYRLGLTKDALDERETATEMMRTLVSTKRHDPAARWLLQNEFVGKDWSTLSVPEKDEFGELLKLLYSEAPNDLAIKTMYADYLIANGDFNKAIPLLDDLSRIQPMRGLQAAALARSQGNDALADRLATRTLDSVNQLIEEDPTNSILALAVAQNQLFLMRHAEAIRTLEAAIRRAKTDEDKRTLAMALGDGIVAWIKHMESTSTNSKQERLLALQMLQVALRNAPNNPRVLTVVADLVLATLNDDDEQLVAVRNALVSGSSPGIAHFIRGTAALMKGDVDRAQTSLELAAKELPNSGAILNNLAVAISTKDEGNLERALQISEQAIRQTPNATPHFYETRGQILLRLGRPKDAIPDLERAVSVPSLAKNAHLSLAKCYEAIGDDEIAKLHTEAAQADEGDNAVGSPAEPAEPEKNDSKTANPADTDTDTSKE
ncbi:Tetratricopeptide repeat protein [Rubripirellula lacrimiformis]|uniref:Tetratricopeptide repeat protein n=1 Tax=Rubripirellula lacrimiformis TaxID=1930273 RepID=A0A517N8N0_9BACT|nr:tetratricopeptide repeat protein [Rubripirellula lacrimiformis]QDT03483.1 Tetratricopeptide repeat protein [Rubripirellula lacrimiformis]